jgi:hypothetical protein
MPGCAACGRGFHDECVKGCKQCHKKKVSNDKVPEVIRMGNLEPKQQKKLNLKDPKSTGRKRAAILYPITDDMLCEWRGKKNCGGGKRPIIGCLDGLAKHRHHGPVKNTTRNSLGNVHRICHACHVHWHELNDLIYDEKDYNLLPHEPVEAEPLEIAQNVLEWKSGAMGEKFELASSRNKLMLDE